jgi:hypothetical protein
MKEIIFLVYFLCVARRDVPVNTYGVFFEKRPAVY